MVLVIAYFKRGILELDLKGDNHGGHGEHGDKKGDGGRE